MKEINKIIGTNLACLRKKRKLTQLELAEKMNYSDKAISKWETGETLPDIETLNNLAKMYNVTLDFLVQENNYDEIKLTTTENNNKIVITCLSSSVVWMLATIIFVYGKIQSQANYWRLFIWAVPITTIILLVFNCIWGIRRNTFILISILTWTLLASLFFQFLDKNIWPIFLVGIPFQIAIILWAQLKKRN